MNNTASAHAGNAVTPSVQELAKSLRDGALTEQQMAEQVELVAPTVPPELLPFLQKPDLATLATSFRRRPTLYWHPLVAEQLGYLSRLVVDEEEWYRLNLR